VTNREVLVELQRELYERNKLRIGRYEQAISSDYQAYEAAYLADVQEHWRVSSLPELMRAIRAADITLVGDYHTLKLAQKTFLKVLMRIRGKRLIVALEFLASEDQPAIDAYLAGRINEPSFLRRTHYKKRWPYDIWPYFKPILELARRRGWRVIGLDTPRDGHDMTLSQSDLEMAQALCDAWSAAPRGTRVMVLVGELHLAGPHLPGKIREATPNRTRIVSVLQNCEPIYWQLVARGQEHEVEVVALEQDRFCVLNTPPVVAQQSYLNFIEGAVDSLDYGRLQESFCHTLRHISRAAGVSLPDDLDQLAVYGPDDLAFWDEAAELGAVPREQGALAEAVRSERTHVLAAHRKVYLANLSVNAVGDAAARFLHCVATGAEEHELGTFYPHALHEALVFFGSKVVNPKRKAKQPAFFRKLLRDVSSVPIDRERLEAATAVLLHLEIERGRRPGALEKIFRLPAASRDRAGRALGRMLGERLYYAFAAGKLSRHEIQQAFSFPLRDPEAAGALYFSLGRQLEKIRLPRRM
jgi:hypothetical protein